MAEQKLLKLTISKVDGPVYDGEVVSVTVPGIAGDMTLLAHHAPLISPLKEGSIVIQAEDEQKIIQITGGTLEVSENHATILI
ncbi:MAG: hypothetical protein R3B69_00705 [Candidatus Paceibacterota bacterium]